MEQMEEAIATGNAPVIVGLVIPIVVLAAAAILQGKVSPFGLRVVSLVRSVLTACCAGMVASAMIDPSKWWIGLALASIGVLTTQTTIDGVRSLLPNRKPGGEKEPDPD